MKKSTSINNANEKCGIKVIAQTSCDCRIDSVCECEIYDELVFLVNNAAGFGGGSLTVDPSTGRPLYACNFMGLSFEATGARDAQRKIVEHSTPNKNIKLRF